MTTKAQTKALLREACKNTPVYTPKTAYKEQEGRDWVDNPPQAVTPVWGEPVPFDDPELPAPLHAEYLGGIFAEHAQAVAASVQVDVSLTVGALLGALSTATMGRWSVQISRDWTIPATLYLGLVADSGEGKSPAFNKEFAPLWDYENERYNADKSANDFAKNDVELIEAELQRAKKEYSNAKDSGKRDSIKASIQGLQEKLSEIKPKEPFRLTTTDTTLERLAKLQAEYNGVMAVVSDEGVIIDTAAGLYSSGNCANIDVLLKSHSGAAFTVDRVGKDSIRTKKPRLTVCVGLQPYQCEKLLSNVTMRERGLPARFLFIYGAPKQGSRKAAPPQIPYEVKERYATAIVAMIKKEPQNDGVVTLSNEAQKLWTAFYKVVEDELRDGGLVSFSPAWAAKFKENVARIAAILHVTEQADPENTPISGYCMSRSLHLGYAIAEQSAYIYKCAASADPLEANALNLLKRIKRGYKPELTRTELLRLCRTKADELEKDVTLLIDKGYLRRGFDVARRTLVCR